MKLLVVNPNTTASMTAKIAAAARTAAATGTEIVAATSAMGPASIEGYYDEAFAVPGLIAAIREGEGAGADAAIIACFDDTGLDAARAAVAIPVVGICEAALVTAGQIAKRIAVVTTLERSVVPLEEIVARYGYAARARVSACDVEVLALEDAGSDARARLEAEIDRALGLGADAIVLGCAGMADLAAALSERFGAPVVDGVAAAVKQAEALVALGLRTSRRGAYATPRSKPYAGVMSPFAPPAAREILGSD
ncbi:allantoin racemase [Methylopila capsulata]|uniref:Hydantoin racemase n=1 Tax=Methylopila capsulata TaxID=61654 RepID=A0A9W6MSZ1_9HYPH|nr:aspartate/glutamate racemase family protein [Methylopila capsulata]MBM7852582.1 allantoin racemase [Methylopila capsulata]GLK56789.1 Asp/Glu/hydantoin racemase [Methylopila capsulata]